MTGRPAHSIVQFAAFLVAFVWALSPVVASIHAEEHAHRFCTQHQRIEESGASATQQPVLAEEAAALQSVDDEAGAQGHTACAFPLLSARSAVTLSAGISVKLQVVSVSPGASPLDAVESSLAPLARAPKASPPRV